MGESESGNQNVSVITHAEFLFLILVLRVHLGSPGSTFPSHETIYGAHDGSTVICFICYITKPNGGWHTMDANYRTIEL